MEKEIFRGQEVKVRIKNRTGGDVVVFKDGTVQFDLYAEEEWEGDTGPRANNFTRNP